MIDSQLLNEYRRARHRACTPSLPASQSLAVARAAIEQRDTNCAVYTSCDPAPDIGAEFKIGPDKCRWVDNFVHNGLRFVGYADKVVEASPMDAVDAETFLAKQIQNETGCTWAEALCRATQHLANR